MPTRYRYYTATTLDGFLADDSDSLDWLFAHDVDEQGFLNIGEFMAGVGALVMGATTYEWVTGHLAGTGAPWPYDGTPTFVFTHRDQTPIAETVEIVTGAPAEWRAELEEAAAGRDVWVVGGGGLAADFAAADMLDEILVSIAPVTLGAGRPLFGGPFELQLLEFGRNRDFLCARYAVIGPLDVIGKSATG
ncbi:dihydrofolate reductase family protein [Skermania piniformis]|uniref:Dihydrofolate reductase family protein n=1 Tax=Skermania pinensis TaxID=39122 RepID=A0ABX8SD54_9ACTN|nr:dihydrofolate reductase family protein [Skermania piniformis]QXQ14882.1 dihydrofolate reductase family protein [Skermania piniformis]